MCSYPMSDVALHKMLTCKFPYDHQLFSNLQQGTTIGSVMFTADSDYQQVSMQTPN